MNGKIILVFVTALLIMCIAVNVSAKSTRLAYDPCEPGWDESLISLNGFTDITNGGLNDNRFFGIGTDGLYLVWMSTGGGWDDGKIVDKAYLEIENDNNLTNRCYARDANGVDMVWFVDPNWLYGTLPLADANQYVSIASAGAHLNSQFAGAKQGGGLYFHYYTDSWQTVDVGAALGMTLEYTSIIDQPFNYAGFYGITPAGNVEHVWWDGASWQYELVDGTNSYTIIATQPDDGDGANDPNNPMVVYGALLSSGLRRMDKNTGSWQTSVVENGNTYIALDCTIDDPNTVYGLRDDGDMYEISWNGSSWNSTLIKAGDYGVLLADSIGTKVLYAATITDNTSPETCQEAMDLGYSQDYDFNTDCIVNFTDFAMFAVYWLDCINPVLSQCDKPWE